MNILVINCGSSSLKFQLIDMTTEAVQAKGLCERIGIDGSRIVYTPAGGEKMTIESPMPTHTEAIKLVLDCLTNAEYGVIKSLKEINAVGHRVVHGGEKLQAPQSSLMKSSKLSKNATNLHHFITQLT